MWGKADISKANIYTRTKAVYCTLSNTGRWKKYIPLSPDLTVGKYFFCKEMWTILLLSSTTWVNEVYQVICLYGCCFLVKLQNLVWGEAEAARRISEDSQVIPQRPAGTAAASGRSLRLAPHMLLAQVLELSLGANLYQREGKQIEHMPSFVTNALKHINAHNVVTVSIWASWLMALERGERQYMSDRWETIN